MCECGCGCGWVDGWADVDGWRWIDKQADGQLDGLKDRHCTGKREFEVEAKTK